MKILFFSDTFPPNNFGGAGAIAFSLALELKKKGHEISIITTGNDAEYVLEGLPIFSFDLSSSGRVVVKNPEATRLAIPVIEQIDPDIIHFHNIHSRFSYGLIGEIKKRFPSIPLFHTLHDTMPITYGRLMAKDFCDDITNCRQKNYHLSALNLLIKRKFKSNPFSRTIIKHNLYALSKIFAVSQELKNAFTQNGIQNIEVIYNGVNVDKFTGHDDIADFKKKSGLENRKLILFGGRISGSKGADQMLIAMKKIAEGARSAVLLMVGVDDALRRIFQPRIEDAGIGPAVKMYSWISADEMKNFTLASDVVVVPSVYLDPFPTVNLEAMASKKPVVGTCFGGTPEAVIDGTTGFIVNPYDTNLVAKKLLYLLDHQDIAKKMGEAGYDRVKKEFSIEKQAEKTLYYYQNAQ